MENVNKNLNQIKPLTGQGEIMSEQEKAIQEFLNKGGKIQKIEEGEKAEFNPLKNCSCGCEGNHTDHSMRKGERGIF